METKYTLFVFKSYLLRTFHAADLNHLPKTDALKYQTTESPDYQIET